jgi:hypothetical protein
MENLDRYARFFDAAYPEYTEVRYKEIGRLVSRYDAPEILSVVRGQQFAEFVDLVRPLTAIKNYKSQVPYPENLQEVVCCIIGIRVTPVGHPDIFRNHKPLFEQLVSVQGFQLPTVSAVFHFCHADCFPIVDVNVKAACAILKERYPNEFSHHEAPLLPAPNTSAINKLRKYEAFVAFIDRIRSLQRAYGGSPTYRHTDKALMVLAVPELRKKAERDGDR